MAEAANFLSPQLSGEAAEVEAESLAALAPGAGEAGRPFPPAGRFPQAAAAPDGRTAGLAIPLIARLCEALGRAGVSFCHWKSNWRLERWLGGEGDLDLLVERRDAQKFTGVLSELGFKQALTPRDRQVPGILDYYGYDEEAERFVHLHVHYQLALGHDLTKNYRLPIERPYLESADRRALLPTPAPEFEFVVFVLRMVLKFALPETLLRRVVRRAGSSTSALQSELEHLEARVGREGVRTVLERHLPFIGVSFFDECVRSLGEGCTVWTRRRVRRHLEKRLSAHARRTQSADALSKAWRRTARVVRERVFGRSSRKRLASGGAIVALVGGDGAGKTTAADELHHWLSKKFVVRRFHLGRPPRSPLTLAVIAALKVGRLFGRLFGDVPKVNPAPRPAGDSGAPQFPGYLQLVRWVCAARDRRRLYARMRRFANGGGVAICDRYVVPQIRLMDGPNIGRSVALARAGALVRLLHRLETGYYSHILPPDLMIVLRLDSALAVRRKTDEHEDHVRTRSGELWRVDWRGTAAHVVDASRPLEDVVAHLRSVVWAEM